MRITESQLRRIVREEARRLSEFYEFSPPADEGAIEEVLQDMGRSIPRMGDTDEDEMAGVLDEIEAALEERGVQWDWSAVGAVAEQENYHAVAFYIPRLKD